MGKGRKLPENKTAPVSAESGKEQRRSLDRVCRKGGRIIILTYMSRTEWGTTNRVSSAIGKAVRISSGNLR